MKNQHLYCPILTGRGERKMLSLRTESVAPDFYSGVADREDFWKKLVSFSWSGLSGLTALVNSKEDAALVMEYLIGCESMRVEGGYVASENRDIPILDMVAETDCWNYDDFRLEEKDDRILGVFLPNIPDFDRIFFPYINQWISLGYCLYIFVIHSHNMPYFQEQEGLYYLAGNCNLEALDLTDIKRRREAYYSKVVSDMIATYTDFPASSSDETSRIAHYVLYQEPFYPKHMIRKRLQDLAAIKPSASPLTVMDFVCYDMDHKVS